MHQTQWSAERPLPPPVSLTSQSHHEKPPEVTCTSQGKPGFLPAPHPEAKPRRWRGRLRLWAPDDPVLSSRSSPGSQPQSFLPPASGLAPPGFFSAARLVALDWAGAAFLPAGGGLGTADGAGDRLLSPCIIVASAVSVSPGLPHLGNDYGLLLAAGTVGAGGAGVDRRKKFPALRKLTF